MKTLYETYRPRTFDAVIAQERAVKRLKMIENRSGFGGKAIMLSGKSGTGKSTLAYIVAGAVADDFAIEELDATRLTPAKLEAIEYDSQFGAFGRGGRAYIVNECHGLTRATVTQLLNTLERIPPHCVWIFTTTIAGLGNFDDLEQGTAFMSRCIQIELSQQGLARPFAEHVQRIAMAEGLDGQSIDRYVKLVNSHKSNMRAAIQSIESGEMLTD
jgi:replication-associated recombination protein RarA